MVETMLCVWAGNIKRFTDRQTYQDERLTAAPHSCGAHDGNKNDGQSAAGEYENEYEYE